MAPRTDGKVAVDCWNCSEGFIEGECTCGEDCCCCLEPDPPMCSKCKGTGVLWVSPEFADEERLA